MDYDFGLRLLYFALYYLNFINIIYLNFKISVLIYDGLGVYGIPYILISIYFKIDLLPNLTCRKINFQYKVEILKLFLSKKNYNYCSQILQIITQLYYVYITLHVTKISFSLLYIMSFHFMYATVDQLGSVCVCMFFLYLFNYEYD